MFARLFGKVARSHVETQLAMCRICGKNRPILVLFIPYSDSVRFRLLRLLPPSPVSRRFGPLLVRLAGGYMDGGQVDDVGRSYLETPQALGQICGKIDRF